MKNFFEARKPKGLAYITEVDGIVSFRENKKRMDIVVTGEDGEETVYQIPFGSRFKVKEGQKIEAGDMLTEGSVNPHDILRVKGVQGVQDYIMREVLNVYRLQGVDIDYKHIEIIIKQMLSKVKVKDPGDSHFLPGSLVNFRDFEDENERLEAEGKIPADGHRDLLGITKASLATDSFLSAASFQETTRVLTEASVQGKKDDLLGLKENVIIGKLIPAGTGMRLYDQIDIDYETKEKEEEDRLKKLEEKTEKDLIEEELDLE